MTERQFRRGSSWAAELRDVAQGALFMEPLVACPGCSRPVRLRSLTDSSRLACGSCGLLREISVDRECALPSPVLDQGEARDPWFGARLWLQAEVAGHLLWAASPEHLRYIERYVSSRIRARGEFTLFGSALGEQLPGWLVSAKNRDAVLRAITGMRQSLDI